MSRTRLFSSLKYFRLGLEHENLSEFHLKYSYKYLLTRWLPIIAIICAENSKIYATQFDFIKNTDFLELLSEERRVCNSRMSWLTEIAGKAENFLNAMDKGAASALTSAVQKTSGSSRRQSGQSRTELAELLGEHPTDAEYIDT